MKSRCYSKACPEYKRYGARGIYVCDEWLIFKNFQEWVYKTQEPGKTIDRIDNNGPYAPWNCRWATPLEQQLNSRRRTPARLRGIRKCAEIGWAKAHNKYGNPYTRTKKICGFCKKILSVKKFGKRARGGHVSYCKPCDSHYKKQWRKNTSS